MTFPSTLSTFNRPNATDRLNSPSHSALHNTVSSAVGQIEAVIGLSTTSVLGTLFYDIRSSGSNGGGHVQTANKGGTGQTTYTKGDILVAQSSSQLSKLAVGTTNGQALIVDSNAATGVTWGVPNIFPTVRRYEVSSSTYTWNRPSNLTYAKIEVLGNGGSGASPASGQPGGGGGGAGGYAMGFYHVSSLPVAASILVREAAVGSLISYFGSVMQATGGLNGAAGGVPGRGGLGSNANLINARGAPGGTGSSDANYGGGGHGGSSPYGGGGTGGAGSGAAGTAAGGYGAGGGGGGTGGTGGGGNAAGGAGTEGVVIITEY